MPTAIERPCPSEPVEASIPGTRRRKESRLIQVLARTPLSPKQQLVVVRVAERAFVLGVSPERIEKVCEMSDPREVIALSRQEGFDVELERQKSRFASEPPPAAPDGNGSDEELEPYRHEIERLKSLVGGWRASTAHRVAAPAPGEGASRESLNRDGGNGSKEPDARGSGRLRELEN